MAYIGADYGDKIAQGAYSSVSTWSKIGFTTAVGTTERDVAPHLTAPYVFLTTTSTVVLASSSTADVNTSGAGAWQCTVYYLKEDFTEVTKTVNLAGTTSALVGTDVYRVNNARIMAGGTSMLAGLITSGTITIYATGTTCGYITAGRTRQRQCVYTVPLNKTIYVTDIAFSSGKQATGHYARFMTKANFDDKAGTVLPRGLFMPFNEVVLANGAYNRQLVPPTKLVATTDLKVSVVSDSNTDTVDCTCTLRGYTVTG